MSKFAKAKDFKKSKTGVYMSLTSTLFGVIGVAKQMKQARFEEDRLRQLDAAVSAAAIATGVALLVRELRRMNDDDILAGFERAAPGSRGWKRAVTVTYEDALATYEPVLGLEVHVELGTATKMFCGCATALGAGPNTQTCPVCLGLPGALPVVNETGVESAVKIGLALNCEIAEWCRFARKNYFYPDMPKNFQTSQYDEPIAYDGYLDVEVDGEVFRVEIERAHMEEDTGKSTHVGGATGRIHGASHSLLDYNRAADPADRDRHQADHRRRPPRRPRWRRRTWPSCGS